VQVIFYFVPQCCSTQTLFRQFPRSARWLVDFWAISDIFKNRFRKMGSALKHHSNSAAQLGHILGKNILPIEQDFAFQARVAHGFVHAVERSEQCGLAATRGADERRHVILRNTHADIEEGLLFSVEKN